MSLTSYRAAPPRVDFRFRAGPPGAFPLSVLEAFSASAGWLLFLSVLEAFRLLRAEGVLLHPALRSMPLWAAGSV
jgi:hypothetical protein